MPSALESRKIKPAKIDRYTTALLLARVRLCLCRIDLVRVEAKLVINLALLLVAQHVVGFGDLLELLLSLFVVGIDVRMIFARGFAEGFANLFGRRGFFHAERRVIIFVFIRGCGHGCFRSAFRSEMRAWCAR